MAVAFAIAVGSIAERVPLLRSITVVTSQIAFGLTLLCLHLPHFRAVSTVDMVQAYPDFLVISFFFHVVHF